MILVVSHTWIYTALNSILYADLLLVILPTH